MFEGVVYASLILTFVAGFALGYIVGVVVGEYEAKKLLRR